MHVLALAHHALGVKDWIFVGCLVLLLVLWATRGRGNSGSDD